MRVARRSAVVAVAATILFMPACSGGDDAGGDGDTSPAPAATETTPAFGTGAPQPLTLPQAQLFASMRVANHRLGQASFATTIDDAGLGVRFRGVVDWEQHVGSAVFAVAGSTDPAASGLVQWNFEAVSVHPGGAVDGPPPAPPADGGWAKRPIDPSLSAADTAFVLLLSLAQQQPENPQLLQQSDAAYLGTEIVAGRTATVFAGPTSDTATAPDTSGPDTSGPDTSGPDTSGPVAAEPGGSSLTYWVADDGALLRLQAALGGQLVTVDFSAAPDTPTEFLPDLLPAP